MEPLRLHAFHRARGANFSALNGREVVGSYGDLQQEHAAARLNACLFDFSFRDTLTLTGVDRISFLHGMLTNDIKRLDEGEATYAVAATAKGTLLADMRILRRRDDLLLDLEPGFAPIVEEFLQKYLVSEDVRISNASEQFALLRALGPQVHRVVAAAFGHDTPLPAPDRALAAR